MNTYASLANLRPAQPGDIRNPNGRPKGSKNWSTVVQDILTDESLFQRLIDLGKIDKSLVDSLPTGNKTASKAIVTAMVVKAMQGDKQAAEWLRKTGYGDKVDVTSNGESVTPILSGKTRQMIDLDKTS